MTITTVFVEVFIQSLQDFQNFRRGMAVQIAGRLVRQQESRVADDRARDGDALLLSAGKLLGQVVDAFFQTDQLKRGHDVVAPLLRVELRQKQRQFHVLKRGKHRNQVEGLKDVPDMLVAPVRGLRVAEAKDILILHQQFAGVGRSMAAIIFSSVVLPEPGGPHQGQEFAGGNVDGDIVQSLHFESFAFENFADVAGLNNFRSGCDLLASATVLINYPFTLIVSPSLDLAAPLVMTLSPPTKPLTRNPSLRWLRHLNFTHVRFAVESQKTTFLPS